MQSGPGTSWKRLEKERVKRQKCWNVISRNRLQWLSSWNTCVLFQLTLLNCCEAIVCLWIVIRCTSVTCRLVHRQFQAACSSFKFGASKLDTAFCFLCDKFHGINFVRALICDLLWTDFFQSRFEFSWGCFLHVSTFQDALSVKVLWSETAVLKKSTKMIENCFPAPKRRRAKITIAAKFRSSNKGVYSVVLVRTADSNLVGSQSPSNKIQSCLLKVGVSSTQICSRNMVICYCWEGTEKCSDRVDAAFRRCMCLAAKKW